MGLAYRLSYSWLIWLMDFAQDCDCRCAWATATTSKKSRATCFVENLFTQKFNSKKNSATHVQKKVVKFLVAIGYRRRPPGPPQCQCC